MRKYSASIIILVLFVIAWWSCSRESRNNNDLITKQIQYDVPVYNEDREADWWVQNIEGANREQMIRTIFNRLLSGKVKAYDFFSYKLLTINDINHLLKQVDTISVERAIPPYDLVDTVMVSEIRLSDIKRVRFLEEWRMDQATLEFNKKVIGICPLAARYSDSGEMRGYKPLFWIFFDQKYPAALKLNSSITN